MFGFGKDKEVTREEIAVTSLDPRVSKLVEDINELCAGHNIEVVFCALETLMHNGRMMYNVNPKTVVINMPEGL